MNEVVDNNELSVNHGMINIQKDHEAHRTIHISGMYENWFLDYASYVILERAVPDVMDGFKPVQRRILHAMKELDDGRYNKVANIIGHTMKFHPHGDASIGDALVQLGQKDLLIDMQGNWGNIHTGDSAAAPRYIEARLSKFALEVLFNNKTTKWKQSYDGRNKEPIALPVKFPMILVHGIEGIAVGLATKILPHNFIELIDASILYLQKKDFEVFPDFNTGGLADFSKYNDGLRSGKIRVRAKISQQDKKTLVITELPFGTTCTSLIDSIIAANEKGKIRIRKIDDNTAENVEILIHLASDVSPDQTIDALYAFTDCEISISTNSCIIQDEKPKFIGIKEILKISTEQTLKLLKEELEIKKEELREQWHFSSLEKIFIEERIYRNIEECTSWESVITTIDNGIDPFKEKFFKEITQDDIVRLTEIKIKRISKYSALKADEVIQGIENELAEVENHLNHLVDYAINYFRQIKKKYGKGKERKTEIRNFDIIQATLVAAATQRLYINKAEGFAGTSLRKDEFVCECSDIDDIIVFREDGTFLVTKIAPKVYVGKNVIHINIFKKNDDRTVYNMIYRDGPRGSAMVKRFSVLGVTRDKEYFLTKGNENSKVLYFTANPNGEAEIIKIYLRPKPRLKKLFIDYDFSELAIKGRNSIGNTLTKHSIKTIIKQEEGVSTLGARNIWYDDTVLRLNSEERGIYLGAFKGNDKILVILKSGSYRLMNYDLSSHFDEDVIIIEKFDPKKIISVVYYDGEVEKTYLKRFQIEDAGNGNKKNEFIGEHSKTELITVSLDYLPLLKIVFDEKVNKRKIENETLKVSEFIGVKSYKAKGKRISNFVIKSVHWLEPIPYEPVQDKIQNEEDSLYDAEEENTNDVQNQINLNDEFTDDGTQMTLKL